MMDNNYFVDLDFFPPAVERLFKLPAVLKEMGGQDIYFKMIGNFPWDFEPRMRSESFYPENVIAHFIKLVSGAGLKIFFLFPGPYDLERLLRLPGYSRFVKRDCGVLTINPEGTGLKSFFESIIEDVVGLVSDIDGFAVPAVQDDLCSSGAYNNLVSECISEFGYDVRPLETEVRYFYPEELFESAGKSSIPQAVNELKGIIQDFGESVFQVRQYTVMSGLCCNAPAAGRKSSASLYRGLKRNWRRLEVGLDELHVMGREVVDRSWLEKYLLSIRLNAEEDVLKSEMRLKRLGLLKHT